MRGLLLAGLITGVYSCLGQIAVAQPSGEKKPLQNSLGMEFARVPAGSFRMGSPAGEKDRLDTETLHTVRLTKGFWMGAHEVTQEQYARVMGKRPAHFQGDKLPVEKVSFEDALEFCQKLSALAEEKAAGRKYRLPTEAEWEYACRAGTSTPFSFGEALNGKQANHNGAQPYGTASAGPNLEKTTPVGIYAPNAWGLYDMHGNVWEWCADWYGPLGPDEVADPAGAVKGTGRVLRGGSWANAGKNCRAADRYGYDPASRKNYLGFRVVLDMQP